MSLLIFLGFAIGLAFGVVGLLSGFCLNSSLKDWLLKGDLRKLRSYAMAAAVAILLAQLLGAFEIVDLSKSIYLQPSFSAPVMFAGGLLFGYGMVLANGCASRALLLLGRGNVRSLIVIVTIAISAEVTLKGLIAPARAALVQWSQVTPSVNSLPGFFQMVGLDAPLARTFAALVMAIPLAAFSLARLKVDRNGKQLAAGVAIGVLIAAGWFLTGYVAADDFEPVPIASLTFVAPVADTLQYVMLATGMAMNFGTAVVPGVAVGGFLAAAFTKGFKVEGYHSLLHMMRSMAGAALMGCGGALAMGCSVGQGLTGFSTLAFGSFVSVAGIFIGAAMALRLRHREVALAVT